MDESCSKLAEEEPSHLLSLRDSFLDCLIFTKQSQNEFVYLLIPQILLNLVVPMR